MNYSFIEKLAEEKIQEAQKQGAFENLPGAGQRLHMEDDSMVPQELWLGYKILHNAGFLPPEIQEKKDIQSMQQLLETIEDETERRQQVEKLNLMIRRLNMRRQRPIPLQEGQIYYEKLLDKINS